MSSDKGLCGHLLLGFLGQDELSRGSFGEFIYSVLPDFILGPEDRW